MTDTNSAEKICTERLQQLLASAGTTAVEAPVIQPADIFLNLSGEALRRRIFAFSDPGGDEVCLRPELTIPVCREYIARETDCAEVRYACTGPVYRYQTKQSDKPREFVQSGVEFLGCGDNEAADADVLCLAVRALEVAQVTDYDVSMGDLALFGALIDALDLDPIWQNRLKREFWRPERFRALLADVIAGKTPLASTQQAGLLSAMAGLDQNQATALVEDTLELSGISPVGGRSVEEITQRLMERAADAAAVTLPVATAQLIADFIAIEDTPHEAVKKIRTLTKAFGVSIDAEINSMERRLQLSAEKGVSFDKARFSTGFGRNMEYYTGLVFEFTQPKLGEAEALLVGGGRYDGLLEYLGAPQPVPAVGCAISPRRLVMAAQASAIGGT